MDSTGSKDNKSPSKKYFEVTNYKQSLDDICDWSKPENVAIEYYDSDIIKRISYLDLSATKTKIKVMLDGLDTCGFIGINSDVKACCFPALILGIQSRGCGFVSLPPTNKEELCAKLGVTFVFSEEIIPDWNPICELDLHGEPVNLLKCKSANSAENIKANRNEFAYAITTSGSTGVPKTVKVPHACIVSNILDLKEIFHLSRTDKIAQVTTRTFDPSIVEIFLSLSSGSTLFVVSNNVISNPHKLLHLICEHGVTLLQTTPSLWRRRWSDSDLKSTIFGKNSRLKVLLFGGEPLPKIETFRAIKHPENRTKIYNIYGVTEVSCWASVNEINLENFDDLETENKQNLGKLLSGTIFQVRNEDGNIIRNGEGVLYIGSDSRVCVLDNETSTSLEVPVFRKTGDLVQVNDDKLFYKGRCDKTVKRFGNKMNLIELEAMVLELKFVKNCLALWNEKHHKLYLCILTMDPKEIHEKFVNDLRMQEELKRQLQKLPNLYQPDRVKYFINFPLTANGKICTTTLMKTFQNMENVPLKMRKNISADPEAVHRQFAQIWKNHMTTALRGFMDDGGNSIKAIQISNELSSVLDTELPELIGLLLRNESLINCVDYVVQKMQFTWQDNDNDNTAINSHYVQHEMNKRRKYDLAEADALSLPSACVWQKCRGKVTGEFWKLDSLNCSITSKLRVEYTRDLKKCVDASPTVFKYSNGEIYASVGSHAGVILTTQLNHPDSISYEINLPDRIEASVLALNDFKGIVGCYDGYIYCLNLKTGEVIWKFQTGDTVKCTALASDDGQSVFVGSYDKYLYCISMKEGTEIWKFKGSEGSISATPCTCPRSHSVVFGTLDGTCLSLNQTSGLILWKNKLKDPIFSAPALLENSSVVFCSVSGEVMCFNVESGQKIWRYKIDGNVFSHLVVRKSLSTNTEHIIISSNNKNIYCLCIEPMSANPILKYSVTFEHQIFATPYCEGNILIVVDTGGTLSLLNHSNGELYASLKLSGEVFSSPVIADSFLVVGCRNNKMYVVRIDE